MTAARRLSNALPRAALALGLAAAALCAQAETIGTVDTAFKLLGRDHDIIVEAYDDPAVQGVTCYVSRARTGGIKGSLGLAEDKAEASIACRQTGPIAFPSRHSSSRTRCSANASPFCSSACASCGWWTRPATRWCT